LSSNDAAAAAKRLLMQEIDRIIAEAKGAENIVRAGYLAGQLFRAYPAAGLSAREIVDAIIAAAAAAGLAVDISQPE
jgi:hypothetical protein